MEKNLTQAQVFTPRRVTNEMLDLLDQDSFAMDDTLFFEPSAGNGEMLIVIIQRIYSKLLEKYNNEKEKAIADCLFKFYAVELDEKLVVEARIKVFDFFATEIKKEVDLLILCQIIISRCISEKIECKNFFDLFKNG